jgi:glycosyltransferase involved in cell wall biosynthesis
MRIAVYCPHYEDAGGVRLVVERLNVGMVARGHALSIITREPGGGGSAPSSDPVSGAEIARVRFVRAPYPALGAHAYRHFLHRFPAAALRLVKHVRRLRPEVIAAHCTKFHAPYVLAMRAASRAPIVVHLHNGAQTADGPESPRLQRLLQRCASRVICVSAAVAEWARTVVPERADRVVAIPNGTDADELIAAPPIVRERPYVLGVGHLAPRKGFDVLIAAVAASGTALDVVLAGDGPERGALAELAARSGLNGRVHFVGNVDRPTVAGLMRGAAAVAVPSRFEGFSLVLREAMAVGAPVVASALPAFPDELRHGETGLLVPAGDAGALGDALRTLVDDPEHALALGRAARVAARAFPSWDETIDRVLAVYERA